MSGPAARATTRSPMPVPRCLASRTGCGGEDTHLPRTAAHILETRWCLCGAWANSTPCIRKEYRIRKEYPRHPVEIAGIKWLRGQDSNLRPSGYEPDELPDCSTPRHRWTTRIAKGTCARRGAGRALGRPGGDLLSHALRRSTIGAEGLYGRVRDGIGCGSLAMATRSPKRAKRSPRAPGPGSPLRMTVGDQAGRAISTGQLHTLPHFHTRPINVVVFHGSRGELVSREASRLDAFSGYPVRT